MASLAEPAPANAQTIGPERALLNRTEALSGIAVPHDGVTPDALIAPLDSRLVDGESALLGRPHPGARQALGGPSRGVDSLVWERELTGEEALLGKSAAQVTRAGPESAMRGWTVRTISRTQRAAEDAR